VDAPPLPSEARRSHQLLVTKRRATALLGAVAAAWLAVVVSGVHGTWTGYLQATLEASMVGGLADWFAVTALFRHPLGLPIPHTAIIAERKDQFGATLGTFIQESFLTPEAVVERVRASGMVDRVGAWLASPANAARLANQVAEALVAGVDLLSDDEMSDTIASLVGTRLSDVEVSPLAGRTLARLTRDGAHEPMVDAAIRGLSHWLQDHDHEVRARFAEQVPRWLPRAVEDRIADRLIDGVQEVLGEMAGDPEHRLRKELDARIAGLATDLQQSPELRRRGEQLKADLVSQAVVREWAGAVWDQAKAELRGQAADPSSPLHERVAGSAVAFGQRLTDDAALRDRVEGLVERAVVTMAGRFDGEIAELVSGTIARWDTTETSRRLELLLGPDLQYIRINGTVVGGAAGLALYALSRAV
jgi:uncharacterized membrane-anchored protein YjiN (DUF445 family)